MKTTALVLMTAAIIAFFTAFDRSRRIEVFSDPGAMLCKKIEQPTTEYTHLCRPAKQREPQGERSE